MLYLVANEVIQVKIDFVEEGTDCSLYSRVLQISEIETMTAIVGRIDSFEIEGVFRVMINYLLVIYTIFDKVLIVIIPIGKLD